VMNLIPAAGAAALLTLALTTPCLAQESAAPAPATEAAPETRRELDLNDLAALLESQPSQRGSIARLPTVEERAQDVLREHMRSCWQMPIDLPDPDRLIVTLQFALNEDGTLRGQPRVVQPRSYMFDRPMRTAIERAITAVRQCSPYPFAADPMLANRYDVWDEFELVFRAP
jgi:hypothetical protein